MDNNSFAVIIRCTRKFYPVTDCKERFIVRIICCHQTTKNTFMGIGKWLLCCCVFGLFLDKPLSAGNTNNTSDQLCFLPMLVGVFLSRVDRTMCRSSIRRPSSRAASRRRMDLRCGFRRKIGMMYVKKLRHEYRIPKGDLCKEG